MRIYIMRHGQAQTFASSDEARPLTTLGEQQSIAMASWLADKQLRDGVLDRVLVSPYLRAQQTWQACEGIIAHKKVIIEDAITPFGNSEQVATYIRAMVTVENISSVLLVSHLPLVSYLTAEFSIDMNAPMFPTSAISGIQFEPSTGKSEVLWLQTPHDLR